MSTPSIAPLEEDTQTIPDAKDLPYLSVRKSTIQGMGLFTSIKLPADKVLFKISGKIVQHKYDPLLSACNPNWLGIAYEKWIEIDEGNMGLYINHSCKPNVMVNEKLQVETIRPIEKNKELLLDYSTTELDCYWSMQCWCGETCCRKTLRSFQYLPAKVQQEYSKYISSEFLKHFPLTK